MRLALSSPITVEAREVVLVPVSSSVVSVSDVVDEEPPSSLLFLAQESFRPKANAKIVGRKRNFSFFIEPQSALDT